MANRSTRTALTALGVVGAVGVAAATWGIGIERHLYTVRRHTLRILPAGTPPLRVLHLSDVHMAPWQQRRQRWLASLAALEPDVIVNTGDNIGHLDGLAGIRAAFEPFRGIPGFFVHGSNDKVEPAPRNPLKYFQGPSKVHRIPLNIDSAAMDAYFAGLGWADLNNTAATIEAKGVRINAFGVSDAHRDWDDLDALPPLVSGFGDGLVWGVTHAPYRRVLDEYVDLGAEMIFAGHTHGGQVRVPFARRALVANCDIPLDQARGLSSWARDGRTVPLNVSAGVGHSIYAPVRFGCRPEASLLELLPA
ncbi:metallophosphatase [Microbacterium mangrovi]|uniref:Metallophosphatase n=1 Tax=Microbacterium mangrovi TaxID=1348253 RepID=A0A0B2A481_9MICO|nr:metallophosphoesterase [Microbacterium mangrovi]KHK96427.1 metallophosphatase [Microbacterium mangrovi]